MLEFHGWKLVESDPLLEGSTAAIIMGGVRERKGLRPVLVLEDKRLLFRLATLIVELLGVVGIYGGHDTH
jgi:hypothetical protein